MYIHTHILTLDRSCC